jgi:hypothetical protein
MREKSANPKDCNGDESQRASDNSGKGGLTMIAWKQGNNGATFVASLFRLLWLETGDEGLDLDDYRLLPKAVTMIRLNFHC